MLADGGGRLAQALRFAELAAPSEDRRASALLIACHLTAASLPCSATSPSDPIVRFAGFAAAAIGRAGGELTQPAVIGDWFRRVRGRIRGSVFVPRDVEYAFAGRYEGLEALAREPAYFDRTQKLLESAIQDARMSAALKAVDADPSYGMADAEARRRRATEILPRIARLDWKADDRASIREVTTMLSRPIS